jgi:FlaA1/EpsC-like NDP-sugar epimerase
MLIFIRKHFTRGKYDPFVLLINTAVYLAGLLAVIKTILRKYFLPVLDAVLLVLIFSIMISVWGHVKFGNDYSYPSVFRNVLIPTYTMITLASLYFTGAYKRPSRLRDVIKGVIISTITVLVVYALLPQDLRFSRAVIVLGGISSAIVLSLQRILCAILGTGLSVNPFKRTIRTVIVSDENSYSGIADLVKHSYAKTLIIGRVSLTPDDLGNEVLGNLEQINEVIRINNIDEMVFSTRELTAAQVINSMHLVSEQNIKIKLAPAGEKLLIGKNVMR